MGHIEIGNIRQKESPSARKVWIEIRSGERHIRTGESPSARKVWIEMLQRTALKAWTEVAFRKEGVD